jgi:hypothetical protein
VDEGIVRSPWKRGACSDTPLVHPSLMSTPLNLPLPPARSVGSSPSPSAADYGVACLAEASPPRFPPLGARATGPGAEGFAQTPLAPTYGRRSKGGGPGRQRFGPKGALGAPARRVRA